MAENKIGFFFGAGTEIEYGFPTGAKFAIRIMNPSNVLNKAKDDYKNLGYKKYGDFLKLSSADVQKVCESMIENRKNEIKNLFLESDKDFDENYKDETDKIFNDSIKGFSEEKTLPEFKLLSKAMDVYTKVKKELEKLKKEKKSDKEKFSFYDDFSTLLNFNISLLFFLYGNAILENLNKNFFTEKVSEFFNDNDGAFMLNKNKAPVISAKLFEVISKKDSEEEEAESQETKNQTEDEKIFSELKKFTKELIEKCIDYQKLFENFDALFYPEKNKTQFKKIVSLLLIMRQTILQKQNELEKQENQSQTKTYYEEIVSDSEITLGSVCTTNYSTFYDEKFAQRMGTKVFHLNGKIDSFFDLDSKSICKDSLLEIKDEISKNLVPFLYPQVAMKPIMYFDVVKLYADAYKSLAECSKVAVLGFGFNKDDNLLNGMFKLLLEGNKNLEIFYFDYEKQTTKDESKFLEDLGLGEYKARFKIFKLEDNHLVDGKNWLEVLKG